LGKAEHPAGQASEIITQERQERKVIMADLPELLRGVRWLKCSESHRRA
jgi:hypothetical protein